MGRALIVTLVLAATIGAAGQSQDADVGLSGEVLTPDGMPVSDGVVVLRYGRFEVAATIGQTGRFRVVPHEPGVHEMYVSAPPFGIHRFKVTVPSSKTMALPPTRLRAPTHFQVRLISPDGESIGAPAIVRQSFDVSGARLWEPREPRAISDAAPDGLARVGPLPRGITTMMVDMLPFARTRLPDVRVTGESEVIDGGTVRLAPGAVLHVQVVDEAGAPVPAHEVRLEESVPFSPVMFWPVRTDAEGRARFERLAAGRYSVITRGLKPCGNYILTIMRSVRVPGAGSVHTRIALGGSLTLRLHSGGVPLGARPVSVTPEGTPLSSPRWLRGELRMALLDRPFGPSMASPCGATTDADGRAMFANMPPGPARVAVRLPHASWVRRITVPHDGRELALEVPTGFLSLRALRADTRAPVAGAAITWTSGGARVEAATTATGDALLDGVSASGGSLAIRAPRYRPFEQRLAAPPDVLHEVPLLPVDDPMVQCRVVTEAGEPVAGAIVKLTPADQIEVEHLAATDREGIVRFFEVVPGSLRIEARAEDYEPASVPVPAHARSNVVITLRAETPAGQAAYPIRRAREPRG